MSIALEPYSAQAARWPASGRHILAHHDDATIVVYQAYRPSIARWALSNGALGGPELSFSRMSWIKPNFLWMMFRSGWGTKENQESILGLRVQRSFFDELVRVAVGSSEGDDDGDGEAWRAALRTSEVRRQWDPDHDPFGHRVERRAIQLGLRGTMFARLAGPALVEVIDMTPIVTAGRACVEAGRLDLLETPVEHVYEAVVTT